MVFGFHSRHSHIARNIIVGMDFDGTVSYSFHVRVAYARKYYGINLPISRVVRDTWPKEFGMDRYERMAVAVDNDITEHQLAPGCMGVLSRLHAQGFRFAVVSKRTGLRLANIKTGAVFAKDKLNDQFVKVGSSSPGAAPAWFIRHHGLPIDYFHSTDHYSELKRELCGKLHARAFIDDDLKVLESLRGTFVMPFFIRQPWNVHQPTPPASSGIMTVNNWLDFGKWLLHIKELHEAICYFNRWENVYYNLPKIAAFWKANPAVCEKYLKEYKKEPAGIYA